MSTAKSKYAEEFEAIALELHGLVAQRLLERLQASDVASGDIQTAIKFLKDNGYDVALVAAQPTSSADRLAFLQGGKLPYGPEEPGTRPAKKQA